MESINKIIAGAKEQARDFAQSVRGEKEKVWHQHCNAWRAHNVEDIVSTYTDDGIYHLVPVDTGGQGTDGLRAGAESFPNLRLENLTLTASGETLVDESIYHFSHTSECKEFLPGVAPSNHNLSVPVICIAEFGDADSSKVLTSVKIKNLRVYWDAHGLQAAVEGRSSVPVGLSPKSVPTNDRIPALKSKVFSPAAVAQNK